MAKLWKKQRKDFQEIRRKYLPKEESKLDELKRLDNQVQNSGIVEWLCLGVCGALVFGLGLCFIFMLIKT